MTAALAKDGQLTPFPIDCDQESDWVGEPLDVHERSILDGLHVRVWATTEPDEHVELCAFYYDNAAAVPLIDVMRRELTGQGAGVEHEIAALERLKGGIDEVIAKLRSGAR